MKYLQRGNGLKRSCEAGSATTDGRERAGLGQTSHKRHRKAGAQQATPHMHSRQQCSSIQLRLTPTGSAPTQRC